MQRSLLVGPCDWVIYWALMVLVELRVAEADDGVRLDSFLPQLIASSGAQVSSRSQIQKILRSGNVTLAGKVLKSSSKLQAGDLITVDLPEELSLPPTKKVREKSVPVIPGAPKIKVLPERIPLEVLYEDDDLLVVNKPKGMAVHGSADPEECATTTGTLVNALLFHCMDKEGMVHLSAGFPEHHYRPGIVHRIDRQTSGVLVVAKSMEAHEGLKEQFEVHSVVRKYHCLCHGVPTKSNGRISSIMGRHPTVRTRQAVLQDLSDVPTENLEMMADSAPAGKLARSAWNRLHTFKLPYASHRVISLTDQVGLLEFELFTGRTHQIRAQMQRLGHPLLFDPLYRTSTPRKTQLHLPVKLTRQESWLLEQVEAPKMDLSLTGQSGDLLTHPDPVKYIGQCLHASSLSFIHPSTQAPMFFEAPFPPYFRHLASILRKIGK